MSEQKVAKRAWVKNAAIIFLAVMLVLTFFSNTILNRSLPEVAVQYAQSGTLNTKIRGSGTVEANSTYEIKMEQSRKVESVAVRVGDSVAAGDVLLVLADGESDELTEARSTLDDLKLQYNKALINATDSSFPKETRAIEQTEVKLTEAKQTRDENIVSLDAVKQAETKLKEAEAVLKDLNKQLTALGGSTDNDSQLVTLNEQIEDKASELAKAEQARDAAKLVHGSNYNSLKALATSAMIADGYTTDNQQALHMNVYLAAEAAKLESSDPTATEDPLLTAYNAISNAESKVITLTAELQQLRRQYSSLLSADNSYEYNKLQKKITEAESVRDKAKETYDGLSEKRTAWEKAVTDVNTYQDTLDDLSDQLSDKQKALKIESLDLAALRQDVSDQQKKVNELTEDTVDAKIVAPQAGIVTAVNITAGSTTTYDQSMITLEAPDLGYTLSFAVTNEQAKKVHIGDAAETTNYYWGSALKATLTQIKNDPSQSGQGKLLVFTLQGDDITAGSTLTLAVGQASGNYDLIVPNSALRSDSNGDFVLALQSKSTPLGTRYIATRVAVQILASDDTSSAVSGGLASWGEYVITTASKPVEPGMQVRLAE